MACTCILLTRTALFSVLHNCEISPSLDLNIQLKQKKVYLPQFFQFRASTAKAAKIERTKISLKAMVTLFPVCFQRSTVKNCAAPFAIWTLLHHLCQHNGTRDIQTWTNECAGRYCYFHLRNLVILIFDPMNKTTSSVCYHTLYLFLIKHKYESENRYCLQWQIEWFAQGRQTDSSPSSTRQYF